MVAPIHVGDKVRVMMENHYYANCTGHVIDTQHGKLVVEITSKSVPDKKNSKT
jgi:ribosomal protein L21E